MKTDRWIWLVGGGLLQIPAVLEAKKMGLKVVVSDFNSHAPAMQLADECVVVSTHDVVATAMLASKFAHNHSLAAVFTQGHSVEYTVAAVAEQLGLIGIGAGLAALVSNKAEMRNRLRAYGGIRQPAFRNCATADHAIEAVESIGFPAVFKPVNNSASRGVTILRHAVEEVELRNAFARAQNNNVGGRKMILVEQYLPGSCDWGIPEQSVETLWVGGKMRWLNWVDRPFVWHQRYAIEEGHYNPSAGNPAKTHALAERVGNALGFMNGILKLDVIQVNNEPHVLETTARLSGGFDAQYTSPLAHGVNYIRGAMRQALGEPLDETDWENQRLDHAVALAAFPKPGKVIAVSGAERARKFCDYLFFNVRTGDMIEYDHCARRPAFAIASGRSRAHAIERATNALLELKIHTEPGS